MLLFGREEYDPEQGMWRHSRRAIRSRRIAEVRRLGHWYPELR